MTDDAAPHLTPSTRTRRRWSIRRTTWPGAIYGTILATTVVATAGHDPETVNRSAGPRRRYVGGVLVGAFVLADGGRASGCASPTDCGESVGIAIAEWPMLQSSWPILLALALGSLGIIDRETSIDVAMAVGIGALFTYGYIMGHQEGQPHARRFLNAAITGGFGLAILALKVVVH